MRVVVDEPRDDGAAAKIDAPRVRPGQLRISSVVPTAETRSPLMATACAMLKRSSTVMILPLNRLCPAPGLPRRSLREGGPLCREHRSSCTRQDRRDDNALPYPPVALRLHVQRASSALQGVGSHPWRSAIFLKGTVDVYGCVR